VIPETAPDVTFPRPWKQFTINIRTYIEDEGASVVPVLKRVSAYINNAMDAVLKAREMGLIQMKNDE
jgi:hypothetical protein